jgi:hypothetical protein
LRLKGFTKYRAPPFSWASVDGKVDLPDDTWMDMIHGEMEPQLFSYSIKFELEDLFRSVIGGHVAVQGYTTQYLNLPLEQKKLMNPGLQGVESYSSMDQSESPLFEDNRAPSWASNILALFLRARCRRVPENKNEDGGESTTTAVTKGKPKDSFESYWLLLYPAEEGDAYFRAGLHVEKEDIESFQPGTSSENCIACFRYSFKFNQCTESTFDFETNISVTSRIMYLSR